MESLYLLMMIVVAVAVLGCGVEEKALAINKKYK